MNMRWWGKRSEVSSTTEDDSDSESGEDDKGVPDGPTLVTLDDGKGGVKHIKDDEGNGSQLVSNPSDGIVMNNISRQNTTESHQNTTRSQGLGDMLKQELKENRFLSVENKQSRIVSKKGHVNIGKAKISQRRAPPTSPTKCSGVTALSTCSTSSIPKPSTK